MQRLIISLKFVNSKCVNFWFFIVRRQIASPVSRKLKYLRNVNDHQLTVVAQHPVAVWRP